MNRHRVDIYSAWTVPSRSPASSLEGFSRHVCSDLTGPNLPGIAPDLADVGPQLVDTGSTLVEVYRCRARFDQFRSIRDLVVAPRLRDMPLQAVFLVHGREQPLQLLRRSDAQEMIGRTTTHRIRPKCQYTEEGS